MSIIWPRLAIGLSVLALAAGAGAEKKPDPQRFAPPATIQTEADRQQTPTLRRPPRLARPREPLGPVANITLTQDGRSLLISGSLQTGTALQFAKLVDATPGLRTVVLDSEGGRVSEALGIAAAIRSRRLDTYVEGFCASACTLVLIAGRDRAISPNAVIGFHRPYHEAGLAMSPADERELRSHYEDGGIPADFVDRVFATPSAELWQPTFEELRAAGIVTRRTLGGETAVQLAQFETRAALREAMLVEPFWQTLDRRHPAIAAAAFDAMWDAKTGGGTDGEVQNAGRAVLMRYMPRLLAGATDAMLDDYLSLIVAQLSAVQRLGAEACIRMSVGQLDPTATLPPELVRRELDLLDQIVGFDPPEVRVDAVAGRRILDQVIASLPVAQAALLADPARPAPSSVRCDALVGLMRGLAALDDRSRHTAARAMFSGQLAAPQ